MKIITEIFGILRHIASILLIVAATMDITSGNYERAMVLMLFVMVNALIDIDDSIKKLANTTTKENHETRP